MVRNTFQEDREAFWATWKTKWGILSFILGNLIYGYLILTYLDKIDVSITDNLSMLPTFLIEPISWIILGAFLSVLGYVILLIIEQMVKISGIKNRRVF